jgi:hypothetical protein
MAHAFLSPSSASRWLTCTPSARLEANFEDSSSMAAEEGTFAHALSEFYILSFLNRIDDSVKKPMMESFKANSFYNSELEEHCRNYVAEVLSVYSKTPNAFIDVEIKLDLTDYAPESYGTSDVVIVTEKVLYLIDLKYGKGVQVEAKENKQLMLYALGALKKYELLFEIDEISMCIYQPRLNNYSSFTMSTKDLLAWGKKIKPLAKKAYEGKGTYVAGSHCKFCKAKASCKTLAKKNFETVAKFPKDANALSDDEIAHILDNALEFKNWLTSVQEFALVEAKQGKKWPGFKLVEGKSNRILTDATGAIEAIEKEGHKDYMTKPELLGLTALEKIVGKSLLIPFITKPAGAPTLTREDDKRPAINSQEAAVAAFTNI